MLEKYLEFTIIFSKIAGAEVEAQSGLNYRQI